VHVDDRPFLNGQRSLLVDDRVWDPDLSDVVEQRRQLRKLP
jgi:hypothetical protein